jgi:hypothetical protein
MAARVMGGCPGTFSFLSRGLCEGVSGVWMLVLFELELHYYKFHNLSQSVSADCSVHTYVFTT